MMIEGWRQKANERDKERTRERRKKRDDIREKQGEPKITE